jgi:hypothetical protein
MAKIIRKEVRKRGFFGWLFLLIFLGFNALMLLWLLTYWGSIGGNLSSGSEAARTGSAFGATIGTAMIFFFWAAGALITGLFALLTRGRKTYVEETIHSPLDRMQSIPEGYENQYRGYPFKQIGGGRIEVLTAEGPKIYQSWAAFNQAVGGQLTTRRGEHAGAHEDMETKRAAR